MKLDSARLLKKEFIHQLRTGEALSPRAVGRASAATERHLTSDAPPESPCAGGVAVGITPTEKPGEFGIGVQVQEKNAETQRVVRHLTSNFPHDLVVQYVGRVRALHADKVRPPVPGVSVGHPLVTAGTLGAFVEIAGRPGIHALSNNHVLAACNRGRVGDPILHPGPIDLGTFNDRIGALSAVVDLREGDASVNVTDVAACEIDGALADALDVCFPYGVTGVIDPEQGLAVKKIGRTTDETDGSILMFEIENLWVDYGEPLGALTFDNQIAIQGRDGGLFSDSGDSGSLVFSVDPPAGVGLLFAGSEVGPKGAVTYANPLGLALEQIHATLAF
ncbi:hypothetical protein [Streptomyces sp. NBC_01643]|uniref:hypothetical protein n=1 Tax=Streptomyces sp. NBC_01643 TaxID=2975906 RepID=UPI00386D047D|nr:S1 family peptidase [Streptomyces sp. NBC_01643]